MSERTFRIINADVLAALRTLPDESVHCCVTSPPYWGLRDYGVDGQMGLEPTPEEFTARLVDVFREVRRVLKDDGVLWLNLGDSYAGSNQTGGTKSISGNGKSQPHCIRKQAVTEGIKHKDLIGIPWMVAFALRADGWYLRSDIIWHKPNPMPESVTDRPTKAHEYLFLLSKSAKYFYDAEAVKEPSVTNDIRRPYGSQGAWEMDGRPEEQKHGGEPRSWNGSKFDGQRDIVRHPNVGRNRWQERKDAGEGPRRGFSQNAPPDAVSNVGIGEMRNKRTVWTISTEPYREAHFAVMPTALVEPCVLAGSPEDGTVLDPFAGSGTVGVVALRHGRSFIGCELNPAYAEMARNRIMDDAPMFNTEAEAVTATIGYLVEGLV